MTTNGGWTWRQVWPLSITAATTPTLTVVSHQPHIAGVQRVWVGGFVTVTDQARVTLLGGPVTTTVGASPFCARLARHWHFHPTPLHTQAKRQKEGVMLSAV